MHPLVQMHGVPVPAQGHTHEHTSVALTAADRCCCFSIVLSVSEPVIKTGLGWVSCESK